MADTRKVAEIVFREDLYPRIETDPALVQRYAEQLEMLPPIEVNQHNELVDGWHRWTAHKKKGAEEIAVTVTTTPSEAEFLALACERNAKHGWQLTEASKKASAIRMFSGGEGLDKKRIAGVLGVTERSVTTYLSNVEAQLEEERKRTIADMWFACRTLEEIGEAVGIHKDTVSEKTAVCRNLEAFPKSDKLSALYQDADWQPPLYDIWNVAKNTSAVKHYGNTASEFVDNLVYTFTDPFEIVIDPFAGGGSTGEVCKRRLRRYWISDRKVEPEMEGRIRQHDLVTDGIAGPYQFSDVALVYLDPPYWKQAAGKYSEDATDLANMGLDAFTATLVSIITAYGKKLRPGAHLGCIISPTQWPNEDKSVNYHDLDLARMVGGKLQLVRRVVCPYSSEQYNGTQVEIAKEQKLWMVLSRTMLVWERI